MNACCSGVRPLSSWSPASSPSDVVVEIKVADDGGAVKIWRGRGEIRRWRGSAGCGRRRREVAVCCGAAVSLCVCVNSVYVCVNCVRACVSEKETDCVYLCV
ncbi:gamma-glutamyl transpeptidase 1 [Striga asiatica]|uniref:Gamma-glutamyl transpeptidase 1 n=1 Tax=Striga asiatica TaxID=4170 RepID=A0A5A7Q8D6_STRAF|nr:gamma-glutamyl transpeptidase 1 [Striga asiatica]